MHNPHRKCFKSLTCRQATHKRRWWRFTAVGKTTKRLSLYLATNGPLSRYDPSNPVICYAGSLRRDTYARMSEARRTADLVSIYTASAVSITISTMCAGAGARDQPQRPQQRPRGHGGRGEVAGGRGAGQRHHQPAADRAGRRRQPQDLRTHRRGLQVVLTLKLSMNLCGFKDLCLPNHTSVMIFAHKCANLLCFNVGVSS